MTIYPHSEITAVPEGFVGGAGVPGNGNALVCPPEYLFLQLCFPVQCGFVGGVPGAVEQQLAGGDGVWRALCCINSIGMNGPYPIRRVGPWSDWSRS